MADAIDTIPEMLRYRWETEPDSRAFNFVNKIGPVTTLTAGEIYLLSGRFASRLRQYGFVKGDVIANGIPNSPERLVTDMGIIMAGCVIVNCQVVETNGANFYCAARMSRCRGVILPHRKTNPGYILLSPFFSGDLKSSSDCFSISAPNAPSLEKAVVIDRVDGKPETSLLDDLRSSNEEVLDSSPSPSDVAVLFATSGSSGFSKLVPQTHDIIFKHGRNFQAIKGITSFTDRPMGWIGGFPFDFLAHGSERYVQDQFDGLHAQTPRELWQVIARTKCQGAALVPGELYRLINVFKDDPPEFKLHFVATGGQPMKQGLVTALGLLTNAIVLSYGATEAGISCYSVIADRSQFIEFRCGKPMKDVELKVVDDEGREVETGLEGSLLLKSPRLLPHYYNMETNADRADIFTPDGFFKTGDRAKIDSEGSLYCYGRSGDVVTLGGILFYMSWPEQILSKCPLLQDSCIVGIEEENGNPFLCACVIPVPGTDVTEMQVIEFFENAVVKDAERQYSMAKMSHAFIMDAFPALPSGKIDKISLKESVLKKLNGLKSS